MDDVREKLERLISERLGDSEYLYHGTDKKFNKLDPKFMWGDGFFLRVWEHISHPISKKQNSMEETYTESKNQI